MAAAVLAAAQTEQLESLTGQKTVAELQWLAVSLQGLHLFVQDSLCVTADPAE